MYSLASANLVLRKATNEIAGSRLATPATLKAQTSMRSVMAWPTEADPLVLYRQSTRTQRAVARELAAAHGVTEFDDEHFVCIGSGRPVGMPVVEIEADHDHWAVFEHVDRSRGDTLLYLNWVTPPPSAWLD